MKKRLLLAATLFVLPWTALAQKNTVMVEINTSRGPTSIPLVRKGDGFVGPRGEYYPTFPTKNTLSAVYGSSAPKSPPAPTAAPANKGELKVTTERGGLRIRRDGKVLTLIETKYPEVRGWKLIRENTAVVVKSGVGREPGFIEMFDVATGRRLEKIKATDIKDGKPAWAKNFAE